MGTVICFAFGKQAGAHTQGDLSLSLECNEVYTPPSLMLHTALIWLFHWLLTWPAYIQIPINRPCADCSANLSMFCQQPDIKQLSGVLISKTGLRKVSFSHINRSQWGWEIQMHALYWTAKSVSYSFCHSLPSFLQDISADPHSSCVHMVWRACFSPLWANLWQQHRWRLICTNTSQTDLEFNRISSSEWTTRWSIRTKQT